jgi:hypothetical protein
MNQASTTATAPTTAAKNDSALAAETTFENVKRGQSFLHDSRTFVKTGQTMASDGQRGLVFHPCQPVTAILSNE